MTAEWSPAAIGSLLTSAFAPKIASTGTDSTSSTSKQRRKTSTQTNGSTNGHSSAPQASIDILLTFDETGVSNHPNHRSLYHGAKEFLRTLMKGKEDHPCPVYLYTLTSTNIARKYTAIFDAPVSMLLSAVGKMMGSFSSDEKGIKREDVPPSRLLFVSNVGQWFSAWKAMVLAHKSQMVWFRWGWITIGRYMVVNDLKRESVV